MAWSICVELLGVIHKLCLLGRGWGWGGKHKDDLLHRPYLIKKDNTNGGTFHPLASDLIDFCVCSKLAQFFPV